MFLARQLLYLTCHNDVTINFLRGLEAKKSSVRQSAVISAILQNLGAKY